MIILVVAHDKNLLIGDKNRIPWHNKEDLLHFKSLTIGKTILMGRVTFEAIGRVLPQRKTIVLSRDHKYPCNDARVTVVTDIKLLIEEYHNSPKELYVCGGSKIYQEFLNYADKLYVSVIPGVYEGDSYFPSYYDKFNLIESQERKSFTFEIYQSRER